MNPSESDTEWDEDSHALCICGWSGKVKEFITIELVGAEDDQDDNK